MAHIRAGLELVLNFVNLKNYAIIIRLLKKIERRDYGKKKEILEIGCFGTRNI
jgi:hypothetical protein